MATTDPQKQFDIEAFRAGDEQQFACVFDRYWRLVVFTAQQFLSEKQDTEDVMSDTFMQLHLNKERIKSELHLKNFLLDVAKKRCIDWKRRRKSFPIDPQAVTFMESTTRPFLDELLADIRQREIQEDIDSYSKELEPELRDTVRYYYSEEMSVAEIAHAMNVPQRKVRYRLEKAKKIIRRKFKDRGFRIPLLLAVLSAFLLLKKILNGFGI